MAMINIKLPTAVLGRVEPDQSQYPRTAAMPGRPSAGSAPGRARKLAEPLTDPATWHAVDAAERWAGNEAAWPYAVLLGPETATVKFAGPAPAATVERASLPAGGLPAATACVCLGSNGTDLVFLDLTPAPGVITVDGDPRAANVLVSSLMAQLAAAAHRVAHIEQWPTALNELEDDGSGRLTFLVWPNPDTESAVRLHRAVEQRPWLRIFVIGDTNGSRWPFTVTTDGVVSSLALGLTAASAGLPEQLPPRAATPPMPPPPIAAVEPEPEPPMSFDGHPGLLPLPPRDPGLSVEPFAPSMAGGQH